MVCFLAAGSAKLFLRASEKKPSSARLMCAYALNRQNEEEEKQK